MGVQDGFNEFLDLLEASRVNSKLDEIHQNNEFRVKKSEEDDISKSLVRLFQDLSNNENNIKKADLSQVSKIEKFINTQFSNEIKYNKPKRSIKNFTIFLGMIGLGIYSYVQNGGGFFLSFAIMGTLISLLACVLQEIEISKFNKQTQQYKSSLLPLKASYPNLSAYGAWLRWRIYTECLNIVEILKKGGTNDTRETMQTMFEIFNVSSRCNSFVAFEENVLRCFNEDLIKIYNNISDEEVDKYNNPKAKWPIKIENISDEDANAFVRSIDGSLTITIMPQNSQHKIVDRFTAVNFVIIQKSSNGSKDGTYYFDNHTYSPMGELGISKEMMVKIEHHFIDYSKTS